MSTVGHYPTDISEAPWDVLQLWRPKHTWRPGGAGRQPLELRRVITGLFYVNKTGGQWRMRPTDIGNGHTISGSFRRWRREGLWARVMETLPQWERQSHGRLPAPSACGADSHSIKAATPGTDMGFDGLKKGKGRKRPLLVDTLELLVAVVVSAANTDERQGLVALLKRYCASGVTRLRNIWVDAGYDAQWLRAWVRSLKHTHKTDLEVVEHTGKGFQVVKHAGRPSARWHGSSTTVAIVAIMNG